MRKRQARPSIETQMGLMPGSALASRPSRWYAVMMVDVSSPDPLGSVLRELHSQLRQKRVEAEEALRVVDVKLEQIERAAAAVGLDLIAAPCGTREGAAASDRSDQGGCSVAYPPKVEAPRTMKEAAVAVLRSSERPLTTLEMLPLINEMLGTRYLRGSLSPQLSRLAKGEIIVREQDRWSLIEN